MAQDTALEIITDETIHFYMNGIIVCRHCNGDATSDSEELIQDSKTLTENDLPTVRKVYRQVIDASAELEARTGNTRRTQSILLQNKKRTHRT